MSTCGPREGARHQHDLSSMLESKPLVDLREAQVVADCQSQATSWTVAGNQLHHISLGLQGVSQHSGHTGCTKAEMHLSPWSGAPSLHENGSIVYFHIEQVHLHIPGNDIETLRSTGATHL